MAATNFTPISLYYSTTAAAVPLAANLVPGELAININDGKLYYENSSGVVTLLAQSGSASPVTTVSFGTTGLTPSTATSGAVTVAGTLAVANGGTGITAFGTGVATALGQNVTGSASLVLSTSPTITTATVTGYTETVVAIGTVGASHTFTITTGTVQTATLTASTPCTFTMPTATAGTSFILRLTQAATGMTTATFTGVQFAGGTAPTITATASAVDIISFIAIGSTWYGSAIQNLS